MTHLINNNLIPQKMVLEKFETQIIISCQLHNQEFLGVREVFGMGAFR